MKKINIKQYGLGRYEEVSPFPVGEMELELNGIPEYSGEFRFVGYNNGVKCVEEVVNAVENRVIIPRDKLNAGQFSCFVSHYLKGIEVKRYPVEDLLITDLNTDLWADPALATMERRIEAMERVIAEHEQESARLREKCDAAERARTDLDKRLSTLEYNNDILK